MKQHGIYDTQMNQMSIRGKGGLFRGKYRRETTRLPWWDYGDDGAYFVSLCIKNRICAFGEVKNGAMILSELGDVAWNCWREIPDHFPSVPTLSSARPEKQIRAAIAELGIDC